MSTEDFLTGSIRGDPYGGRSNASKLRKEQRANRKALDNRDFLYGTAKMSSLTCNAWNVGRKIKGFLKRKVTGIPRQCSDNGLMWQQLKRVWKLKHCGFGNKKQKKNILVVIYTL